MPDLFIYLLKANVALSLFYLAYRLGLRRLTFYTLNRFFLLTGIVFSSVFPLVDVNDFFHRNEKALGTVVYYVPDFNALKPAEVPATFTVWTALTWVFWIGVAVMTIRLLLQMFSLLRFHMMSDESKLRNRKIRVVEKEIAPFSFFRNIYLNPAMHSHDELDAVIRHEQVHVEEWHSADVLMGEVNNVFYWFNPGAWLMKTAIRENLEFITDRKMLRAGVDAKAYQYSLLKVSGAPYATAIANNFNFSHLKNRIMMMNKERSSRYQIVRYVVLGCMVSVLVLTLNFSRAGVMLAPVGQGTIPQLFIHDEPVKTDTVKPEVVVTGYLLKKGTTTSVKLLSKVAYDTPTVKNLVITGIKEDSIVFDRMFRVRPDQLQGGEEVRVSGAGMFSDTMYLRRAKVKFPDSYDERAYVLIGSGNAGKPFRLSRLPNEKYSYLLDGTSVPESVVRGLDSRRLKKVSVTSLDDGSLVEITTKEPDDKMPDAGVFAKRRGTFLAASPNGIYMTDDSSKPRHVISVRSNSNALTTANVLTIVDGVPDSMALKNLDSKNIESITVLKDASATAIYGPRGANGVILITTKKNGAARATTYHGTVNYGAQPRGEKQLEEVVVVGRPDDAMAAKPTTTTIARGKLTVFPNPSDGEYTATFLIGEDGKYELNVANLNGANIVRKTGTGEPGKAQVVSVSIPGPAGNYFMNVRTGGKVLGQKLIKRQ